ncbi:MAG: dephospho-CoA kinase [Prevotella sp.]|nr:dephospho-CoA kinase [Prevotella sp.]
MKIAITGGIGSGKSYVCRLLRQRGIEVYDCDAAAKRLMRTSDDLKARLTALIGPEAYTADGLLNKGAVARFLLQSEANARAIDAIVHPAVVSDFLQSGCSWMESAILYQAGIAHVVDRVIAVTAPREVRIGRIMQRDGISREKALEWLGRQWPQDEVRRLADYEIVNDGRPLEPQITEIINNIEKLQQNKHS